MPLDVYQVIQIGFVAIGGAFTVGVLAVKFTKSFSETHLLDKEAVVERIDEEIAKMRKSIDDKHAENVNGRESLRKELHDITQSFDNRYVLAQVYTANMVQQDRRLSSLEAKTDQILTGVMTIMGRSGN